MFEVESAAPWRVYAVSSIRTAASGRRWQRTRRHMGGSIRGLNY